MSYRIHGTDIEIKPLDDHYKEMLIGHLDGNFVINAENAHTLGVILKHIYFNRYGFHNKVNNPVKDMMNALRDKIYWARVWIDEGRKEEALACIHECAELLGE